MNFARTVLVALTVLAGALAPATRSAGDGARTPEAARQDERQHGDVRQPPERSGGSFPGAIGWVALGLGIAFVIVLVGLSDAETVSE